MKRISGGIVAFALLATPLVSLAATQEELQAQAAALIAQIQLLQQQLTQAQSTGGSTQTTTAAPAATGACPQIGRTLKRTSTGDDVTRLQQFLAADPTVYPEGTVTGYFGALTEMAVQRWQAKFKIVSSGTPDSTGYGVVGPRTAAAIAIVCSGGSVNGVAGGTPVATTPAVGVGGFIQVTPISGNAPLTASIQAVINTTRSCGAATYALDFGDGTPAQVIQKAQGQCNEQTSVVSHVYATAGTYKVTLSAGGHSTQATVTVFGSTTSNPTTSNPTPSSTSTLAISITDTTFNPKNVTIAPGTRVTWTNNGTMNHNVIADNGSFNSSTLPPGQSYALTFTLPGLYPYYCSFHGGAGGVGQSGVITVAQGATNPTTPTQQTFGPLSVTPGSGGNLSVSVSFNLPGCPNYSLSWGDGTAGVSSASAGCPSSGIMNLSHTYSQSGNYTITLVRGNQTDGAAVVVSN